MVIHSSTGRLVRDIVVVDVPRWVGMSVRLVLLSLMGIISKEAQGRLSDSKLAELGATMCSRVSCVS
jgi:hypothetical protein